MKQQRFSQNVQYLCRYARIRRDMIAGMTHAEQTDSISRNFIAQMIPHHEAAIAMSENILQYSACAPVRAIAESIITEQTNSIAQMRSILSTCASFRNFPQDIRLYEACFRAVAMTMFRQMGSAAVTGNLNADFMREMIPHHAGAIRMSENALRYPICPELLPVLNAIMASQSKGIREMEALLRCM